MPELFTALSIAKLLSDLGAGIYAGRDQRRQQREINRANRRNEARMGYANVRRAFGGNPVPNLVEPDVVAPGKATTFLGGLGKALGAGLSLYELADAKKLRDLQRRGLEYTENMRKGIDAGLAGKTALSSLGKGDLGKITSTGGGTGPYLGAGPGGMEETPLQLPETTVTAQAPAPSPSPSMPPGYQVGLFKGQQMLQERDMAQLSAIAPFLEYMQDQDQLQGTIDAIIENPRLFDKLPASERAKALRFLPTETLAAATQRPLSEKSIGELFQVQIVLGKVNGLQAMMEEAVSRNITGPIEGNLRSYLDSRTWLGELFASERTGFLKLGDDELLVQIENMAQSLIPTLRNATKETGVMTEKDEARIRNQLPNIYGINDTRELAKLPRLISDIEEVVSRHFTALEGQRFDVGIESFAPTQQELFNEFLRRYQGR